MKTSIKLAIAAASAVLAISIFGINLGSRIGDVNQRVDTALSDVNSQVAGINSQIENVVSFLSTTTTSTTTTTTTTVPIPVEQAKVIPAKSELVRKVDEIYPGASDRYGADTIEKAGVFACKRWNEAPITRLNVIRDILEYTGIDDLTFGHAVAEAVVWTICWENRSFPNGPRDYR